MGRARDWLVVLVVAGAAGVSQTFGRFTYSLLLTDIRDDFGLSNTVAGGIGTINLVAYLAGTVVVSLTVARLGVSLTTRLGILTSTIGIAVLAWSPGLPVLVLGQLVTGFAGAAVWVTAPSLASARIDPARRGLAIGLTGSGIGGAIVVASLVGANLPSSSWRRVYVVLFVLALVISLAALVLLRDDVESGPSAPGRPRPDAIPGWRPLLGAYALFGLSLALFVNFLVAALRDDAGYGQAEAAAAFSAFGFGTIFGGLTFGSLSDRWGRRRALLGAFALMTATSLVIPTGARPWATVAAFGFGVAFTAVPTGVAARIRDCVDGADFGRSFGVATLAFGAALMIGPQLGGVIGDLTGSFTPVFLIAAGASAVGAILAWRGAPQPSPVQSAVVHSADQTTGGSER